MNKKLIYILLLYFCLTVFCFSQIHLSPYRIAPFIVQKSEKLNKTNLVENIHKRVETNNQIHNSEKVVIRHQEIPHNVRISIMIFVIVLFIFITYHVFIEGYKYKSGGY